MKESNVPAFYDSSNILTAEKVLVAGTSVYYSRHLNNGNIENSNGNAQIGAKIDTASLTVTVAVALFLGDNIGYGPYRNILDETIGARVATFDSTKVFQASLFNQTWFNSNHMGFKIRFIIVGSISGGEIITCENSLS